MKGVIAAVAASLVVLAAALPAAGATVPPGFKDELVARLGLPTAIAFTPDERILVTTQDGTVRVIRGGALVGTPALDLRARVCSNSERGLLGVAVDPAFAENGHVYLYYTFKKSGSCPGTIGDPNLPVNRVSRFTLSAMDTIDPASESVVVDSIPSPVGNHNGGDVHFGRDGHLYVSIGDGGCDYAGGSCGNPNDAARDRHVLLGKILRVTKTGGVPPDNPFVGANTAPCGATGATSPGLTCRETFAWGLRNPFRIAFDSNAPATRFFINDVGGAHWEEIDEGQAGADYGWNVREGHCATGSATDCGPAPAGMTNPIFDYAHAGTCNSISGGAFVPNGAWSPAYDGAYLYADHVCGTMFALRRGPGGSYTSTTFGSGFGMWSITTLAFGPAHYAQALYYLTYAGGGAVRRIVTDTPYPRFVADFDGNGKDDIAVFRPSNGNWYTQGNFSGIQWGQEDDIPVPGNYDADAADEIAVYRPSNGTWYVHGSESEPRWGQPNDIPVPADYDGDGETDVAVFESATGMWYLEGDYQGVQWGQAGDIPVPGNYAPGAADEMAVFRPSTGTWYVRGDWSGTKWGWQGDIPVPADYDGNGTDEFAVFRPTDGTWYALGEWGGTQWGQSGDVPLPGDFDADPAVDRTVFRPSNGGWYSQGNFAGTQWGQAGDIP